MTPPAEQGSFVVEPSAVASIPSPLELLLARGRTRALLAMLGPAFVAAIAYVDPGNFATNVQGGAQFGYLLLWVVLMANLMAMLVQYLSAKLGIVTDMNLPEVCRATYPRYVTWFLWLQAEGMAMATDIAEFVGAALGLNLLFGVPLLAAGFITGGISFLILGCSAAAFAVSSWPSPPCLASSSLAFSTRPCASARRRAPRLPGLCPTSPAGTPSCSPWASSGRP